MEFGERYFSEEIAMVCRALDTDPKISDLDLAKLLGLEMPNVYNKAHISYLRKHAESWIKYMREVQLSEADIQRQIRFHQLTKTPPVEFHRQRVVDSIDPNKRSFGGRIEHIDINVSYPEALGRYLPERTTRMSKSSILDNALFGDIAVMKWAGDKKMVMRWFLFDVDQGMWGDVRFTTEDFSDASTYQYMGVDTGVYMFRPRYVEKVIALKYKTWSKKPVSDSGWNDEEDDDIFKNHSV